MVYNYRCIYCTGYVLSCVQREHCMYSVHSTLFNIHCALYTVHCALNTTLYNSEFCTMFIVHCIWLARYIVNCTSYIIQYTLCSVICTLYIVYCTLTIIIGKSLLYLFHWDALFSIFRPICLPHQWFFY